MNIIRILHITSRADKGGGPKHIDDLIDNLNDEYMHFVAAPERGDHAEGFKKKCAAYCVIPYRKFSLSALFRIYCFIMKNNIRIIHSHGRGAGFYSRMLGLVSRVPVIHTHHGLYLEKYTGRTKALMVGVERLLNLLTKNLVFVSSSEVSACVEAGAFASRKSVIIPNCVKIPDAKAKIEDKDCGQFNIVAVTRLESEKGNDFLIDIAQELSAITKNFRVTIIGDGPERLKLENKIKILKMDKYIELLGVRNDVPQLLQKADAYITSSHGEAHSIAMLEAMSYSLPVIASRVRGHSDMIIDGYNGYLFELGNANKAAIIVHQIMRDTKLAKNVGEMGRRFVANNFSIDSAMCKIKVLYRDAVVSVNKF